MSVNVLYTTKATATGGRDGEAKTADGTFAVKLATPKELGGAGEELGTRQSGLPEFRLADLLAHAPLVATARDDARLVLHRDPELTSPRGQALRTLLYLFERDAAARYLRSG